MISVSKYDIPFLRHMTSYMTCFGQNGQIRMDQHQIWYSGVLGNTWVTQKKNKLCSDWGHNVDVLVVFLPFYGSIIIKWDFFKILSYQIL